MSIEKLEHCFNQAILQGKRFIGLKIKMKNFELPQIIIDPWRNFDSRLTYYKKIFGNNLISEDGNEIIDCVSGNSFEEIQSELF